MTDSIHPLYFNFQVEARSREVDPSRELLECSWCPSVFLSQAMLSRHWLLHHLQWNTHCAGQTFYWNILLKYFHHDRPATGGLRGQGCGLSGLLLTQSVVEITSGPPHILQHLLLSSVSAQFPPGGETVSTGLTDSVIDSSACWFSSARQIINYLLVLMDLQFYLCEDWRKQKKRALWQGISPD